MHELSLYSTVPSTAHAQVLQVLAGISATLPTEITERHLIFKPRKKGQTQGPKVGGSQGLEVQKTQSLQSQGQGELFYLQLVGEITDGSSVKQKAGEDEVMKDAEAASNGTTDAANPIIDLSAHQWHLRFSDVPEVGKRPVTSRLISTIPLASGDVVEYMDGLGYDYQSEHVLHGHRFVHHNVVLLLYQLLPLPPAARSSPTAKLEPRNVLPPIEDLKPLDPSGGYALQAYVRIVDGNRPELVAQATDELKALKSLMKGICEMDVAERLALDTRVK